MWLGQKKRQILDSSIVFDPLYSQSWPQCLANSRSSINVSWMGGFLVFFSLTSCTLSSSKRASDTFVPPFTTLAPFPFPLHTHIFSSSCITGDRSRWHTGECLLKVAQRPQQKMVLGSAGVWAAERSHTRKRSGVTLLSLTSSLINQQNLWHDEWPKNDLESALRDNKCRFWVTQNLSSGLLLCLPFH